MLKTDRLRWLPVTTQAGRRAALAVAGLGLITALSTTPIAVGTTDASTAGAPVTQLTEQGTSAAPPLSGNPGTTKPADKPATKPADKPAAPAKAPSAQQLLPRPVTAPQQAFTPTAEQMRNAEVIVKTGQNLKLPPRAQVIAVATALQESTLHNYGHLGARNDHDSQGLFQQRPSYGWGTPEQITTPTYAATKFYNKLIQVDGWDKKPLTVAAQTVQVSAFPDHYAKWEKMAADLVLATHGTGPYAEIAKADKAKNEADKAKDKSEKR